MNFKHIFSIFIVLSFTVFLKAENNSKNDKDNTYHVKETPGEGRHATSLFSLSESTVDNTCNQANSDTCDGSITVTVGPGGTAPYTYKLMTTPAVEVTTSDMEYTFTGLCAGTYTVRVFDANFIDYGPTWDNWNSISGTINEPAAISTINFYDEPSCFGRCDGSISVFVETAGTYSYRWDAPIADSTSSTVQNLCPGEYYLTITQDGTGCYTTYDANLPNPPEIIVNEDKTDVLCHGQTTGEIDLTVSGGAGSFSYDWNTDGTGDKDDPQDLTNIGAGSYAYTVYDADDCPMSNTVTITQPNQSLQGVFNPGDVQHVNCFGGNDGFAIVTPDGGTSPYSYDWSHSGALHDSSAVSLIGGDYTVTITDDNNCTTDETVTITTPIDPFTVDFPVDSITNVSCYSLSDGRAVAVPEGGAGNNTFIWSPVVSGTEIAQNIEAGKYYLTVQDQNNCTANDSVTINQPDTLLISANPTDPSCFNSTDGSATTNVVGGTTDYTFEWSNSETTQNISDVPGGDYVVTVTDANGCTDTTLAKIVPPPALELTASVTNILCNDSTTGEIDINVIGGTGDYTYSWEGPDTYTSSAADITDLAAGDYDLTVQDNNGCSLDTNFTITRPTLITVDVDTTHVTCFGLSNGEIDITPNGGVGSYSYDWDNDVPAGFDDTQDLTGLTAGNYTVTVQDGNNCPKIVPVEVLQPDELQATGVVTDISCGGQSSGEIDLTVTGGTEAYTFDWDNDGTGDNDDLEDISGVAAGIYEVIVTDANSCQTTFKDTIEQVDPIIITADVTNILCNGDANGAIDISVTGGTPSVINGFTYDWDTDGTGDFDDDEDLTGLDIGDYTLVVKDSIGCTETVTESISQPDLLVLSTLVTDVRCFEETNGAVDLTITGGAGSNDINWSGPDSYSSSDEDISNLEAGTYNVTVEDGNGCPANTSAVVNQPDEIVIGVDSTNVRCYALSDGTIDLTVNGGTNFFDHNYDFNWSNAETTEDLTSLGAGEYRVTVTDSLNCTALDTVEITQPDTLNSSINGTAPLCSSDANGDIDLEVTGGTTNYTYDWDNDGTGDNNDTQDLANVTGGWYKVIITDANSCQIQDSIQITPPNPIVIDADTTNVTCYGLSNGALNITPSGGTGAFTYDWDNDGTGDDDDSQDLNSIVAGTYTVIVYDNNACSETLTMEVTEPDSISLTKDITNPQCNGDAFGEVDLTVTGGTLDYTYTWEVSEVGAGNESIEDQTGLTAGMYHFSVTDGNSCEKVDSIEIIEPDAITVNENITHVACYGESTGSINIAVNGGTGAYTYNWEDDNTYSSSDANINGLAAGNYHLTVQDNNGCTYTNTYILNENPEITVDETITEVACFGDCSGAIDINVNGGDPAYNFIWSGPNTYSSTDEDISSLCPGTYNLIVRDASFCNVSFNYNVSQPGTGLSANMVDSIMSCGSIQTRVAGETFLPDGDGASYTTSITYNEFLPGETIDAANDIVSICANMEHSYLGDLDIFIECPNGQTATLKSFPGGTSTFLGEPVDNDATIRAGIGYDYCWRPDADKGTMISEAGNYTYSYIDQEGNPETNKSYLPSGSYLPNNGNHDFSDLVGCPLNGTWTINITDNMPSDNGYIFSWMLNFDPSVYPNNYCNGMATVEATGGTGDYTYSWNNGETTAMIDSLCSGEYNVIISDANGCTVTDTIDITDVDLTLEFTGDTVSTCFGDNDANVTAVPSNGSLPYLFEWSNNETTAEITGLTAGYYTVTVMEGNGCYGIDSVLITQPTEININKSVTNVACNSNCEGQASVNVSGGTPGYTYAWSNTGWTVDSTNSSISNLCEGNYYLEVTDNHGCTKQDSAIITQPQPIDIEVTDTTHITCFGDNDGALTSNATGGTGLLRYSLDDNFTPSQLTGDFNNLSPGEYTIYVRDGNLCVDSIGTIEIIEPDEITFITEDVTDIQCFGETNGEISVEANGGTPSYEYILDEDTVVNGNFSGLEAGTYNVTVVDANGCDNVSNNLVIDEPNNLQVSVNATNSNCGLTDGEITSTVNGGTGAYTYEWSNSETTADISGVGAGTYTLSVTDNNGCLKTRTAIISDNDAPTLSFSDVVGVDCYDDTDGQAVVNVNGTSNPYTYDWQGSGETSANASALPGGIQYVEVEDAIGCIVVDSIEIPRPDEIVITVDNIDNASCPGVNDGEISVSAIGGTGDLEFSLDGSNYQSSGTFAGLAAGSYTVTVRDDNTCTKTSNAIVIDAPPAVIVDNIDSTHVTCYGIDNGTITVTASGGTNPLTYTFDGVTENGTGAFTGLAADTYTVTITDANGCSENTRGVVLEQPDEITFTPSTTSSNCNQADGSASVTAAGGSGGFNYTWNTGATGDNISNVTAGTYYVTAEDVAGCLDSTSLIISDQDAAVITLNLTQTNLCYGDANGSIESSLAGGTANFTYSWAPSGQTSPNATGLESGTHTLQVRDANGCISVKEQIVPPVDEIVISIDNTSDVSCYGLSDGVINASAVGGTGTLLYSIDGTNYQANGDFTGLDAGTYTVYVTDDNSCINTYNSIVIDEPSEIVLNTNIEDAHCSQTDGNAVILPSGGAGGFSYQWDQAAGGGTTAAISNVIAGAYHFTVTDANGCQDSSYALISDIDAGTISFINVSHNQCYNQEIGQAAVSMTGGTPSFDYSWSNGQNGALATGLGAGNYYVSVVDDAGCIVTDDVDITEPTEIQISLDNATDITCYGDTTGILEVSASGGTPAYLYTIDGFYQANGNFDELTAGNYTVTVQDANGCLKSSTQYELTQGPEIIVNMDITPSTCGFNDGAVNAQVSGGVPSYTYEWESGETTSNIENISAGNYPLTITDGNSCTKTEIANLSDGGTGVITFTQNSENDCYGDNNISLTANITGGTPGYTYQWGANAGNSTNATVSSLPAGTFGIEIEDAAGCIAARDTTITEPAQLTVGLSGSSDLDCYDDGSGEISMTLTGGTPAYLYSIDNGSSWQNNGTFAGLDAGTYTLIGQDANSCQSTTQTLTLTQPDELIVSTLIDSSHCNLSDGGATAIVSGGSPAYNYQWDASAGSSTNATVTNLPAGAYDVTVTDNNLCTKTESITISDQGIGTISFINIQNNPCFGDALGQATVSVSGAQGPLTYEWQSGENTNTETGLTAGAHPVTVTDVNGCNMTRSVTITQPDELGLVEIQIDDITCNGYTDGVIKVGATGGTSPFDYSLDNGVTTQSSGNFTGLEADTYIVNIVDNNACEYNHTPITIDEPTPIVISIAIDSSTCTQADGAATANVSGGSGAYGYQWDVAAGSQTTQQATNLSAGSYTVTVTTDGNCPTQATANISDQGVGTITFINVNHPLCFDDADGAATVSMIGGTPDFTYQWGASTGNQTGITASNLPGGTHSVNVTDGNGCIVSDDVNIIPPTEISISLDDKENVSCNGLSDGSITVSASGGTPPYQYSIDGGSNYQPAGLFENLIAGTYTIMVKDGASCTETSTVIEVTEPDVVAIVATVDSSHCNSDDGGISLAITGGTSPYTYQWGANANNATSPVITDLFAGNYSITVTDNHTCAQSQIISVADADAEDLLFANQDVECFGESTGASTVSVSPGANGPYDVLWGAAAGNATTNTVSNLSAGSYNVQITDATGCVMTASTTITERPEINVTSNYIDDVTCAGENDGALCLQASGGTPAFLYSINNGSSWQNNCNFSNLAPGSYTVKVKDSNGCIKDSDPATINEGLEIDVAVAIDSSNCTLADGAIHLTPSNGTTPYQYNWDSGQNTSSITNVAAGTYMVTVTESGVNNCSVVESIALSDKDAGVVTFPNVVDNTCYDATAGEATAEINGGTSPYTYNWGASTGNQTGATASNLPAGTHCIDVEDANGCIVSECVDIVQPTEITISLDSTRNITCNGDDDGAIFFTATNGTPPYQYSINGVDYYVIGQFTGLSPDSYTLYVKDAGTNCVKTYGPVEITEPQLLSFSSESDVDISCYSYANGSIDVVATGGTPQYTYTWDGATYNNNGEFSSLDVGDYIVTVNDANGCSAVSSLIAITQPEGMDFTLNPFDANCQQNDGSVEIAVTGGTGPYTYAWDDPASQTTATASGLYSGTYNVTVTDANTCAQDTTVTLADIGAGVISFNATNPECFGYTTGSVTAGITGGTSPFTYDWSEGTTGTELADVGAGTYTLTVEDANNCLSIESIEITQPQSIGISIDSTRFITCFGDDDGAIFATATGGTPGTTGYTYSIDNFTTSNGDGDFTGLSPQEYTVYVQDENACQKQLGPVEITSPALLAISSEQAFDALCYGQENGTLNVATTGGTSPITYSYDTVTWQGTGIFPGVAPGSYYVTAIDNNGCEVESNELVINEPADITLSTSVTDAHCLQTDGSATVNPVGGTGTYTYRWGGNAGYQDTQTAVDLQAGIYNVTVTDVNGCSETSSALITDQDAGVIGFINVQNNLCYGDETGQAEVDMTGGTAPFTYDWEHGPSTALAENLGEGSYPVLVYDLEGCISVDSVQITAPEQILLSITDSSDITCYGLNNGQILSSATGGVGVLEYTIDNFGSSQVNGDFTGLVEDVYTVMVRDANGCITSSNEITIDEPYQFVISIMDTVDVRCFGEDNGTIASAAMGGTGDIEYSIDNSAYQSSGLFDAVAPGDYRVYVQDENACVDSTEQFTISQPEELLVSNEVGNDINCYNQADGNITVNVEGGTEDYTYSWNGIPQDTGYFENLDAGTYVVTVIDANGCSVLSSTFNFTNPDELDISISDNSNVSCAGEQDGFISVTATGGTGTLEYATDILGPYTNENLFDSLPGDNYKIYVRDINGCADSTLGITIVEPPAINIVNEYSDDINCYGQADGSIFVNAEGGTGSLVYSIEEGITQSNGQFSGLDTGTYMVTVTDDRGCSVTSNEYTFIQPDELLATVDIDSSHCTLPDGSATVSVTGGTLDYTYDWSSGGSNATENNLSAGYYTVTVNDANDCILEVPVLISDSTGSEIEFVDVIDNRCFGSASGQATAIVIDGDSPYQYDWSNGDTDSTATDLEAGLYLVAVTDNNGCIISDSISIGQEDELLLTYEQGTGILCYGDTDGSIVASAIGGFAPYEYSLDGVDFQPIGTFNGLSQGEYVIYARDNYGCPAQDTLMLEEPDSISISTNVSDAVCYGQESGVISVTATGGTPSYSYSIDDITYVNQADIENLEAGTYTVYVQDYNGCNNTLENIVVGSPDAFVFDVDIDSSHCTLSDGVATINVTGGTGPYNYLWETGQTVNTVDTLSAGAYNVTITDVNSCIDSLVVLMSDSTDAAINFQDIAHNPCFGYTQGSAQAVIIGGVASYTYTWDNGQTGATAVNLESGVHAVAVEDGNGCVVSDTVQINQPNEIEITTLDIDDVLCHGDNSGLISVSVTGGTLDYTFNWSPNTSEIDSIAQGLEAGDYNLTVVDANSCEKESETYTITEPDTILLTLNNKQDISCAGETDGQIVMDTEGGTGSFEYTINGTDTINIPAFTDLEAGVYTVTVIDDNGCEVEATSVNIIEPWALTINANIDSSHCGHPDGSAQIVVAGGTGLYTYEWEDGNTDSIATDLAEGTYYFTVQDANGCTKLDSAVMADTSLATVIFVDIQNNPCFNDTLGQAAVDMEGNHSFEYEWSSGETDSVIVNKDAGWYIVSVTDAFDCISVDSVQITQPSQLLSNGMVTDVKCYDGADGAIEIDATGGTGDPSYAWSNSSSDEDQTELTAGEYILTITDENGCEKRDTFTVTQPDTPITLADSSIIKATCSSNAFDGAINVNYSGGTPGYEYLWSNDSTVEDLSEIEGGTYILTITDANECVRLDTFTVLGIYEVYAIASNDTAICYGESVQLSCQEEPYYNYIWTPGDDLSSDTIPNPVATPEISTDFELVVTAKQNSNCWSATTVNVEIIPQPVVDAGEDKEILLGNQYTLNGSVDVPVDSISWYPDEYLDQSDILDPITEPNETTTYYLFVRSDEGCTALDSMLLTVVPKVVYPEAFSPNNGDAIGNTWDIRNVDFYPELEVYIYNRWGKELYYSKGYAEPWDGTYNGKDLPTGTYYYVIILNDNKGTEPITGPVSIIR